MNEYRVTGRPQSMADRKTLSVSALVRVKDHPLNYPLDCKGSLKDVQLQLKILDALGFQDLRIEKLVTTPQWVPIDES